MAAFEDENENNTQDRAMEEASNQLKKFQWIDEDIPFFFQQVEARMSSAGVKKQWSKFTVLQNVLPMKVLTEVKPILRKSETDFADGKSYKALKQEILRIFGPTLESGTERALKRTMTGKPSQLAREIIDDICPHSLQCPAGAKCIAGVILAIWKRTIPTPVQAAIADKEFNQTNLESILKLADAVYDTCRPAGASVAAIRTEPEGATGQVSSSKPAEVPEGMTLAEQVAALRKDTFAAIDKWYHPDRGTQRQGRRTNSGGRGGRSGGQGGRGGSSQPAKSRGPRHADGPPTQACSQHWRWGRQSYYCSDPLSCPWKDQIAKRPTPQ